MSADLESLPLAVACTGELHREPVAALPGGPRRGPEHLGDLAG